MAKYKISDAVQKDMQQTYRGMGIDEKELQQLESKDYKYQSLDNEVLEQSKNDFMDWMKSSSNKKYGYDFSDPEDIERFEGGKVSKLYEGTYSDNFMDQWLKNNGYASQDYFDTYYKKAEETVYRNRYNESVYNEFKSDVFDKLRENPDAATKSITKDDVSIAVSEVLMSDSKYKYLIDEGLFSNSFAAKKTIEDYESDDNFSAEAKYKRDQAAALYDSLEEKKGHTSEDLMNEFTSEYYLVLDKLNWQSEEDERLGQLRERQDMIAYRNRKSEETQAKKAAEAEEAQAKKAAEAETDKFIKDIIAKDKDVNKIVVQSNLWGTDVTYDSIEISDKAHDDVYDALEARGLSRYEISAAMARNGMDISRATKYAQFKQEEHRVDNELTAELKDTMRDTGISVALAEVKSGQDDTKIGQVSTFADVWRAQKIEEGYDPLAVDNALLREGMEGILSDRTVAEDYMRYVYTAGYGVSAEEAQAQISTVSEEEWEWYEKDLKWNADVDESKTTLSERMVPGIIARAALGIASGAVGAADMVVDWVDGRERGAWEITKDLADTSAKMREWATNEHAPGLSAASDIGSEILRMYALSAVGGAAGAGAKAAMGATGKGAAFATSKAGRAILSVAKNAPFISSAVGDYYSEARLNGASASDATQYGLICGVAEGVLEKASVGEALSGAASRRVASNMAARGFSGFASKYGLAATNMFTSALGEFLEESASTTISAVVQRNTWNPNARVDAMEVLQSGGMGAIIGAIMGGASSPVTSRRYELALDILADNNATAKQKILAQDLLTANEQTFAEKLDSLMAATYAETLTEKERAAVMQNGATVMQHDEYVATREALTNAETQLQQEQERYEERNAQLDANLQKQEEKVETLRSRFSALDVRDPRSAKRYAELMGQINSAESNLAQIQESTIAQKKAAEKEHTGIVDNLHKTIADNSTKLNRHYVAQYNAQFPVPQKTAEEGKKAKQAELILLEEKWATGDIQAIEDLNRKTSDANINIGGVNNGREKADADSGRAAGAWNPSSPYSAPWADGPGAGQGGDAVRGKASVSIRRAITVQEQAAFQRVIDYDYPNARSGAEPAVLLDDVPLSQGEYESLRFFESLTGTSCSFYKVNAETPYGGFSEGGYLFINIDAVQNDQMPLELVVGHEWAHAAPGVSERLRQAVGAVSQSEIDYFRENWQDEGDTVDEMTSNATGVIFYALKNGNLPSMDPAIPQHMLNSVCDELVKMAKEGILNKDVFFASAESVRSGSSDFGMDHPSNNGPIEYAVNQQALEMFDETRRRGRDFYKNFVSGFAAGERAAQDQAKLDKGSATLEEMAQIYRNAGGTVDYIMEDGLVDRNRKDMGLGSFVDLMTYPDAIKDKVQDYVLNLHNIDRMSLMERGLGENKAIMRNDDGSVRTAEQSREIVKQMEQENPELAAWNERKNRWWNAFGREWIVNTGLVSEEDWATWHATYQNYVPTKREKYQSSNGSKRGKKGSGYSEIREATGATSEVVDIRESLASYINGMVRAAAKNDVVRNLYDFTQRNPNAASPYARIAGKDATVYVKKLQNPNPFDSLSEESFSEVVDGEYVLRCKVDGEWQEMYVSKDIYDAFGDLFNRSYGSGFEGIRQAAENLSGFKRSVITGFSPLFAISNTLRDVQTAYINDESVNPGSFVMSYLRAIKDMATKSDDYARFRAYGGDRTGFFKANEGFLRSSGLADTNTDKAKKIAKDVVMAVPRAFAKTGEVSEAISRYASAKRYVERHGNTDENWKKAMLYSADLTTNFSRSGPLTKYADAFCIYLNANVQGLDKMARQFKHHPLATIGKVAGIALADELVKLLTRNNENEHYQNLSTYVKDQNYLLPNVFGEKDDYGYYTTFIAIPKAQGYGAIISMAERLASVWDEDKSLEEAFDNFSDTVLSALPVDPSIPIVSSVKQAASNTSWSGATIEPSRLESELLQERYENDTSVAAIRLSEFLVKTHEALGGDANDPDGFLAKYGSPAKLQYILDQESGIIGDILLPATAVENYDKFGTEKESYDSSSALKAATDTLKRRFVKDPLYSNNIIGEFYNETAKLKIESQQAKSERQEAGIDKKTDTEILYGQYYDVSWWLTASYKAEREILNSQTNSKERDKKLHDIRKERLEVVKGFMEHPKTFKIPD